MAKDKLVDRVLTAMDTIGHPEQLTLDELCRVVPILEAAAERYAAPGADGKNVITFGACRRRRARRIAAGAQSSGAGAE
ncbi:hypothetical protein [Mycobacterium intracellulare]|uniref:hypothetical protein n=1 Tax=Mycobacterium intracellulare TaxID=1767 RepID=UPI001CD93869|nr:hypothetical protein [Mycobacterium intracellulare]MCA2358532.1 hypothetical protein [Mycobacterium intracellulare]MCA2369066.1 hypothetical protein [Mycobacterium intracellulare]